MTRLLALPTKHLRALVLLPVAGVLLAGCQWTSPVQTDHQYNPADGRTVFLSPTLSANNVLIVADKQGGQGTLVGQVANNTDQDVSVTLTPADAQPIQVSVPAHGSTQLTDLKGDKKSTIDSVPVPPGGLVDIAIKASTGQSESLRAPVVAPYAPYGDYSTSGPITPTEAPPSEPAEH